MGRVLLVATVLALSGCATTLPLIGVVNDDDNASASTFRKCAVGYYLAGLAIDAIIITGDAVGGSEWNLYDGFVVVPLGLDALLTTSVMIDCVRDN